MSLSLPVLWGLTSGWNTQAGEVGRSCKGAELLGKVRIFRGWLWDWKLRRNDRFTMAEMGGKDARWPELAGRAGIGGGVGGMGLWDRILAGEPLAKLPSGYRILKPGDRRDVHRWSGRRATTA